MPRQVEGGRTFSGRKGMGFQAAQKSVEGQGKSPKAAAAIIAAGARNASPKAKKANPNLKRVAMPKGSKGSTKKGAK